MNARRQGHREPLWWALAALVLATVGLPHARPLFAALFPQLDRPLYQQDTFVALVLAHVGLVLLSSAASVAVGVAVGVAVTRDAGREFKAMAETLAAVGQTLPPVAVLAVAAPVIGFGFWPAWIALALYGLLPVLQATVAGLASVPAAAREAARGLGMGPQQVLWQVEWPLALPVVLGGVRSSVIINIGTAAVASTVGAKTLGSPIIIGLSGFNTAYVLQGAVLVALLAVVVDLAFERYAPQPVGSSAA